MSKRATSRGTLPVTQSFGAYAAPARIGGKHNRKRRARADDAGMASTASCAMKPSGRIMLAAPARARGEAIANRLRAPE